MDFIRISLLVFAVVSTRGEKLFEPCNKDDLKCLGKATETYLSKTYMGYPAYGIKPVDPYVVEELDVVNDEKTGVHIQYLNSTVTGFRTLKISDFKMDMSKFSVVLKMQVDFTVDTTVKFVLRKENKVFTGPLKATATSFATSQYGLSLKQVDGKMFFTLGPETTTCEIRGDPKLTLDKDFEKQVSEDPDITRIKAGAGNKRPILVVEPLHKLAEAGFKTIIHNIRAVAAVFPTTDFFNDI